METPHWAPTTILIDATYLDAVAGNLIHYFDQSIGRQLPKADLCHWLDCITLDGGITPGDNRVQAVFIHAKENKGFQHFAPSDFDAELNGKAFKDHIAEFLLSAFPVEPLVPAEELFLQSFTALADAKEIERLLVVGDMNAYGKDVAKVCTDTKGKDIVLFSMSPLEGEGFRQQVVGYSIMSALGIRADEL